MRNHHCKVKDNSGSLAGPTESIDDPTLPITFQKYVQLLPSLKIIWLYTSMRVRLQTFADYLTMVDGKVNGKPLRSSRLKCIIGLGGLGIPPCMQNHKPS